MLVQYDTMSELIVLIGQCDLYFMVLVVVVVLFYVQGKHLRSCRDGQLT